MKKKITMLVLVLLSWGLAVTGQVPANGLVADAPLSFLSSTTSNLNAIELMPKVSTNNNDYWYYMKSLAYWNFSDVRAAQAIKDIEEGKLGNGVDAWRDNPTRFRVIQGAVGNQFGIKSEFGRYLQKDGTFSISEFTKWEFEFQPNLSFWGNLPGYRLISRDNNNQVDASVVLDRNYLLNTANLQINSSAVWSFVLDKLPGSIKISTGNIINQNEFWYFLRNMSPDRRLDFYLTASANGEIMKGSSTDSQCWKIMSAPTVGKVYLVNKAGQYAANSNVLFDNDKRTMVISKTIPDKECEWDIRPGMNRYNLVSGFTRLLMVG